MLKQSQLNVRKMLYTLGKRETYRALADLSVAERLAKRGQSAPNTRGTDWLSKFAKPEGR